MIELQNVTKIFNGTVRAVDEVSFNVAEEEIFGLIGTSGCGKTTTLKMINRLVEPTSGSILINGESVNRQPAEELRRSIGYVIQNVGLFPHYTIRENIAVVPRLRNWEDNQIDRRCGELMELVGLEPEIYSDRMPDALSGGQQQRVGLARALAADPPVVLMDEPFGALDPITKDRIRREFKKLLDKIGKTIVLVTHDIAEAFDLCDRVCLMDEGRVQQIGTPKELLLSPSNSFVDDFFDMHRLELEMQTITAADIINVTGEIDESIDDGVIIEINFTAREILNHLERSSAEHVIVLDSQHNRIGGLHADDLLAGFYKTRNALRGGDPDG